MQEVLPPGPRKASKLPGWVNAGAVAVILASILAIALRSNGASPPPIAEFAPTVQHTIQKAPQEQSSVLGNGPNGATFSSPTPPPGPKASPTIPPTAKLHHCVGDPPRQIEYPQS